MSIMDIYYALDTWIEGSCVKDIKRRTALLGTFINSGGNSVRKTVLGLNMSLLRLFRVFKSYVS